MTEIIPFPQPDFSYGACTDCDEERFFLIDDGGVMAIECSNCGIIAYLKPDTEIEFTPDF